MRSLLREPDASRNLLLQSAATQDYNTMLNTYLCIHLLYPTPCPCSASGVVWVLTEVDQGVV
eukprot:2247223-Karenia_brevis.AAC.1